MTEKTEAKIQETLEDYIDNPQKLGELSRLIRQAVESETYENQVLEFHQTFNQIINERPCFPPHELLATRLSYILEESSELAEACGHNVLSAWQRMLFKESQRIHNMAEEKRENLEPNLKEALDALCDLQYFLSGTAIVMGFHKIIPSAFRDVHESNMSKVCETKEISEATQKKYLEENIPTRIEAKMLRGKEQYLILRDKDGKVLKSIEYQPVELSKYVI
jgi:predicted HAD superfamily Cof-like phosphohydrolase